MADEDQSTYDYTRPIRNFIFPVGIIILFVLVASYIVYKIVRCFMSSRHGQFRRVSTSTGGIPLTVQNTGTSTGCRVNTTNTIANTTLKKPKEPGYYYYDGGNFLVKCREVPRAEPEPPPVLIPEVSYEYANSSAPPVECSSYSKY